MKLLIWEAVKIWPCCSAVLSLSRDSEPQAPPPCCFPRVQLKQEVLGRKTLRLTADLLGPAPKKLISSFEMVSGNCR